MGALELSSGQSGYHRWPDHVAVRQANGAQPTLCSFDKELVEAATGAQSAEAAKRVKLVGNLLQVLYWVELAHAFEDGGSCSNGGPDCFEDRHTVALELGLPGG